MSSWERLARFHGESIPWSSTSFQATTWLNPRLRNISSICLTMVGIKLTVVCVFLPSITVTVSSFYFSLFAPIRDSSSSSTSQVSPSGCSGTSCSSCGSCFWLVNLINGYQLCKRDISSSIPGNASCTCRMLGLMVSLCVVSNNSATWSINDIIYHATCCSQKNNTQKNHLPHCFLWWLQSLSLRNW